MSRIFKRYTSKCNRKETHLKGGPPGHMSKIHANRVTSIIGLLFWLSLSALVGWFGSQFSADNWYIELTKPNWTPPGWIFGPVWTILYILMAVSAWLIWKIDSRNFKKLSIRIYLLKMICNGLWSYVFFGLHEIGWAFVNIIVLFILIIWVTILFYKERIIAGILLFPYIIWVGFASILNLKISNCC